MSDHLQASEAGGQQEQPDARVDVTGIIAGYGAAIMRLIGLLSVPLDAVEFELQRMPRRKQGTILRLAVHARRTKDNDGISGEMGGQLLTASTSQEAGSQTQSATEIGTLPVDIRNGSIGAIVLAEDDRKLLDEMQTLMPARSCLARVWQMVTKLLERWAYGGRPECLRIADIKDILRRHDEERRAARERQPQPIATLGDFWKGSRMLLELLNRRYGHLGTHEREKLEIRWYLLEKAGYIPGAS